MTLLPAGRLVDEFIVPSEPGNEQLVMQRVADAVANSRFAGPRLERLRTSVAEAVMNAIEHGNDNHPELLVEVVVFVSERAVAVRITDQGGGRDVPAAEAPDIDLKLRGEQSPRGWGLFVINNMVDDLQVFTDDTHHTVELLVRLEGERDD